MNHILPILMTTALCSSAFAADAIDNITASLPQPASTSDFYGFKRFDFKYNGITSIIVTPKKCHPARPWIWRARFFGHEPQTDVSLLNDGFILVYHDVAGLFGAPSAVARWNLFYYFLVKELKLSPRPVLEGMSRGGLIILNWAKQNPDKVAAIYADAPVCDFKSWPLNPNKNTPGDAAQCLKAYGLTAEQAAVYADQPFDKLEALANKKVPVLCVCGASDSVVPMVENTNILVEHYRKLGGPIRVIAKHDCEHHPHSLKDPSVIANFLKANSIGENDFIRLHGGSLVASCQAFRSKTSANVAFLGGSITEMNGYTKLIEEKLKALYPSCKFKFINAGISSTCSDTGAFRIQKDILSKVPQGQLDLLFVEFAVNDNQDGHFPADRSKRAMEGIVRQALKHSPNCDIIFLYSANESHLANYAKGSVNIDKATVAYDNTRQPGTIPHEIAAHEAVAEHYRIPSINFAADVQQRMQHGEFDWQKFGGVHPAPFGAAIYGDDVACLLEAQLRTSNEQQPPRGQLPLPMDSLDLEDAGLVTPDKAQADANWTLGQPDWKTIRGSFRKTFANYPMIYATKPGATLTLSFQSSRIGICLLAGPDAGILQVSIDSQTPKDFDLYHPYSSGLHYPYSIVFAEGLDKTVPHTIKITISEKHNAASSGTAARIMYFEN
jgi:pimeloyl-ACP methyl ester carboxylesterase